MEEIWGRCWLKRENINKEIMKENLFQIIENELNKLPK